MDNNYAGIDPARETIIRFEEGIPGFEDVKDYVLLHEDDQQAVWSLQAADGDVPSFVVLDPFAVCPGYRPVLTQTDLEYLGESDVNHLCFLVIAVIRPDQSECVVNLKAPLIISASTKKGRQVILEQSDYPIRYPLFRHLKNSV